MQQVLLETPPSDEVGREPEGVCKLKWPKLAQNAGYFNPNFHQKIDRTRSNSIIINGFSSARVCFRFNISLKGECEVRRYQPWIREFLPINFPWCFSYERCLGSKNLNMYMNCGEKIYFDLIKRYGYQCIKE